MLSSGTPSEGDSTRILTGSAQASSSSLDLESLNPELVIALVGALGTDLDWVATELRTQLTSFKYSVPEPIRISSLLRRFRLSDNAGHPVELRDAPEDDRIETRMAAGDALRRAAGYDFLALLAVEQITKHRPAADAYSPRYANVLQSLKNPEEVFALRRLYGPGFWLVAVHSPPSLRLRRLASDIARSKGRSERADEFQLDRERAERLIAKDEFEPDKWGQRVRDTFHLGDFFLSLSDDGDAAKSEAAQSICRFLRLLLGDTTITPDPDEQFMYFAQAAAARSSSHSRQVGAVVVSPSGDLLGVGCNDAPRAGGGLYWSGDHYDHREITLERDSSDVLKERMIEELLQRFRGEGWIAAVERPSTRDAMANLNHARIMNLIEFSRACHAEQEAILAAGRTGRSAVSARLYSTTFPCHDCAKLIVGAGIANVVYIEPYPKSLALDLAGHAIVADQDCAPCSTCNGSHQIAFRAFTGVGPRRYLELFSVATATGLKLARKDEKTGVRRSFSVETALPRVPMQPVSYRERERLALSAVESKMSSLAREPQT